MLLTLTTDKLSLITSVTCDVDVVVSFTERNQATGDVGATIDQETTIATATTTDVLGVPGATTDRKVELISIRNAHATTAVDVTLQLNANSVLYELHAARLYAGERLEWTLERGFVLTKNEFVPTFKQFISEDDTSSVRIEAATTVGEHIHNCFTNIAPSKFSNLTRTFSSFAHLTGIGAASTTGIQAGLAAPYVGGTDTTILAAVTNSVTAATLAAADDADAPAIGTSATVTPCLTMVLGRIDSYTEDSQENHHSVALRLFTEVAGSQVTIGRGASWNLFEATG